MSIKDLVRRIRCCKTLAEERALIATECANIRTGFREDPNSDRRRNVTKLLFIHILGHATNFGQIECLKLVASDKFSDKRIGYLGLSLLLNENMEILMLVTNSIKLDLSHPNHYVSSLALTALANIGTLEMFQSLDTEIQYLLQVSNPLIKKKAALCMKRYILKLNTPPSIIHDDVTLYIHMVPKLILDQNHGVVSSGCVLLTALLDRYPDYPEWSSNVPVLIERMYKLIGPPGTNGPVYGDCSIGGIPDPFLQSKILRLLCRLSAFKLQPHVQRELNNLLAQIATQQDTKNNKVLTYNPGVSVQYACVECIFACPVEKGLRLLASNIIKRFLESPDNNLKCVALNILQKIVKSDTTTAQRHINYIVHCLLNPDIYIRKVALNVSFLLTNQENVLPMVKHFSNILLTSNDSLKRDAAMKISHALTAFYTPPIYQLEMYIKLLSLTGSSAPNEILSKLCDLIRKNPDITDKAISQLFVAARSNINQLLLVNACLWSLSECVTDGKEGWSSRLDSVLSRGIMPNKYPHATTKNNNSNDSTNILDSMDPFSQSELDILSTVGNANDNNGNNDNGDENTEKFELPIHEVISFLIHLSERVLSGVGTDNGEYLLNCLCKLSLKYPEHLTIFREIISKFRNFENIELQQRACEFYLILGILDGDTAVPCSTDFVFTGNDPTIGINNDEYSIGDIISSPNTKPLGTNLMNAHANFELNYPFTTDTNLTMGINLLELDFLKPIPQNESTFNLPDKRGEKMVAECKTDFLKPNISNLVMDDPFTSVAEEAFSKKSNDIKIESDSLFYPTKSPSYSARDDNLKIDIEPSFYSTAIPAHTATDTSTTDHMRQLDLIKDELSQVDAFADLSLDKR
ncbi:AP-1 complex subunit gamma-1 [Babesia microti strain RI]|uniref:AP-1 complex subunit gamma-1 n=1 Tax=Babesia microti (strain RI) TaxID=1133968 RepID=A0A0K3AN01_BABMR|nr:AP-1 complex subunit gamma-1 [Babesia microti strain RI]CTQ41099.1 AP-1 complex subunit gamma-1 [Babesia microti strain RI]|eukprot:XP_012649110.1 AP-1 complex subunit gamma-1 [Babesia microti strain RI]